MFSRADSFFDLEERSFLTDIRRQSGAKTPIHASIRDSRQPKKRLEVGANKEAHLLNKVGFFGLCG